jgi:cobalt-zinc-cadmium efflux system membrane fusion protein
MKPPPQIWFAAALLLCSCAKEAPAPPPTAAQSTTPGVIEIPADSPKLKQIQVAAVAISELPTDEFTAPGTIEVNPNLVTKVLLPVPGRVTDVHVRFGDAVQRDQVLLQIESPEADAASSAYLQAEGGVAQAKSSLLKAENDVERIRDLFRGDAIAKKELVAAETGLEQSRALLKQAEAALQQSKARLELLGLKPGGFRQKISIHAPLPGKITEMTVVAGEYRNDLSAPLITIADLSTVWVSADVPESSIRLVKVGERFDVKLSAFPGETFQSRVARIADSVDPQTRTIEVWAELANPNGRFRPEMFGEVRHIESFHRVPAVPVTAVVQSQGRTMVYAEQSPGRFKQTDVVIGNRSGDLVPILSGVSAGDRVVVDGAMLLRGY